MTANNTRLLKRHNDAGEPTNSVTETATCPECDAEPIRDDTRGERVCPDCGIVVEDGCIDHGPEWRAYNHQQKQSRARTGAPKTELIPDKGLSTRISQGNTDQNGNTVSQSKQYQLNRLRKWNRRIRIQKSTDRNLQQALDEIKRMSSALGLPKSVSETASIIYRRALDEDLLPGRSIEGIATASLYAATRHEQVPRTFDEMAIVSRVERRRIGRAYRYLSQHLKLSTEPTDPVDYLPRFGSELDLSQETIRHATDLLNNAKEQGIHSGKSPTGLAAAAIYATTKQTDEDVTQQTLSDVTNVAKLTIRNRYPELLDAQ